MNIQDIVAASERDRVATSEQQLAAENARKTADEELQLFQELFRQCGAMIDLNELSRNVHSGNRTGRDPLTREWTFEMGQMRRLPGEHRQIIGKLAVGCHGRYGMNYDFDPYYATITFANGSGLAFATDFIYQQKYWSGGGGQLAPRRSHFSGDPHSFKDTLDVFGSLNRA